MTGLTARGVALELLLRQRNAKRRRPGDAFKHAADVAAGRACRCLLGFEHLEAARTYAAAWQLLDVQARRLNNRRRRDNRRIAQALESEAGAR